ncbi:hypothetical protein PENSPDRAFT_203220 [Peniophora sp. CONT]|nr:hypothetical protein PENSPDRAFT_203220 [Peniophora sp. CONT]
MQDGHPDYGCFISQEKTLTNFEGGALVLDPHLNSSSLCLLGYPRWAHRQDRLSVVWALHRHKGLIRVHGLHPLS